MVRAGYIEYGKESSSIVGVPQGGIASPILSNLILHELDRYVEKLMAENEMKLNSKAHTMRNPEYSKIDSRIQGISKLEKRCKSLGKALDEGGRVERLDLIKLRSKITSTLPKAGQAKFYYVRYADD